MALNKPIHPPTIIQVHDKNDIRPRLESHVDLFIIILIQMTSLRSIKYLYQPEGIRKAEADELFYFII